MTNGKANNWNENRIEISEKSPFLNWQLSCNHLLVTVIVLLVTSIINESKDLSFSSGFPSLHPYNNSIFIANEFLSEEKVSHIDFHIKKKLFCRQFPFSSINFFFFSFLLSQIIDFNIKSCRTMGIMWEL